MVLTINGLTKSEIQLLEAEYNLLEYDTGEWDWWKEQRKDYLYLLLINIHSHPDYWKMFLYP